MLLVEDSKQNFMLMPLFSISLESSASLRKVTICAISGISMPKFSTLFYFPGGQSLNFESGLDQQLHIEVTRHFSIVLNELHT